MSANTCPTDATPRDRLLPATRCPCSLLPLPWYHLLAQRGGPAGVRPVSPSTARKELIDDAPHTPA